MIRPDDLVAERAKAFISAVETAAYQIDKVSHSADEVAFWDEQINDSLRKLKVVMP